MLADCCMSLPPIPIRPWSTATEWYRIQNVSLGSAYSFDTGVIAKTGSYTGQYWKLTPLGDGRFRLTNEFQGDSMSFDTTNMATSGRVHQGNTSGR